jgi:hypothetical protein
LIKDNNNFSSISIIKLNNFLASSKEMIKIIFAKIVTAKKQLFDMMTKINIELFNKRRSQNKMDIDK